MPDTLICLDALSLEGGKRVRVGLATVELHVSSRRVAGHAFERDGPCDEARPTVVVHAEVPRNLGTLAGDGLALEGHQVGGTRKAPSISLRDVHSAVCHLPFVHHGQVSSGEACVFRGDAEIRSLWVCTCDALQTDAGLRPLLEETCLVKTRCLPDGPKRVWHAPPMMRLSSTRRAIATP